MNLLLFLAVVCFAASSIWSAATKAYTLALIAAGLTLWVLAGDATLVIKS